MKPTRAKKRWSGSVRASRARLGGCGRGAVARRRPARRAGRDAGDVERAAPRVDGPRPGRGVPGDGGEDAVARGVAVGGRRGRSTSAGIGGRGASWRLRGPAVQHGRARGEPDDGGADVPRRPSVHRAARHVRLARDAVVRPRRGQSNRRCLDSSTRAVDGTRATVRASARPHLPGAVVAPSQERSIMRHAIASARQSRRHSSRVLSRDERSVSRAFARAGWREHGAPGGRRPRAKVYRVPVEGLPAVGDRRAPSSPSSRSPTTSAPTAAAPKRRSPSSERPTAARCVSSSPRSRSRCTIARGPPRSPLSPRPSQGAFDLMRARLFAGPLDDDAIAKRRERPRARRGALRRGPRGRGSADASRAPRRSPSASACEGRRRSSSTAATSSARSRSRRSAPSSTSGSRRRARWWRAASDRRTCTPGRSPAAPSASTSPRTTRAPAAAGRRGVQGRGQGGRRARHR